MSQLEASHSPLGETTAIPPRLEVPADLLAEWLDREAVAAGAREPACDLEGAFDYLVILARDQGHVELGNAVSLLRTFHRTGADALACRVLFDFSVECYTAIHTERVIGKGGTA
jgi:hypothetical protein